jgi:hypothetical protein
MPSSSRRSLLACLATFALGLSIVGCNTGNIDDEEAARRAYLGLDPAVDRALKLGFDGFNAADNANIPDQTEPGDLSGTMTVGGQVDSGASDNKQMRLDVTLTDDYSDGPVEDIDIVYNGGPMDLDLSMQGLPNASLTGTFIGTVAMAGDLVGDITLNLTITGETEQDPDTGDVRRKAGTIHVVGTATSDYGVFDVDVSL